MLYDENAKNNLKLISSLDYNKMEKYISELDEGIENPTPVIVSNEPVNRKHKKQATTHFKNYKTETKGTLPIFSEKHTICV